MKILSFILKIPKHCILVILHRDNNYGNQCPDGWHATVHCQI